MVRKAALFSRLKAYPETWWTALVIATAGNTLAHMTFRLPPRPLKHCARLADYVVAELFNWSSSLSLELKAAKGFYAIIVLATLVGMLLDFSPIDPVKPLLSSAVINGVISVPLMIGMMGIATQQKIMGRFVIGVRLKWLG